MLPNDLVAAPDAGGMHSAPQLGQVSAVTANYKLAWLEYARAYGSSAVEGALFGLFTLMACCLLLLDRSDPVYRWLALVFLLAAIERGDLCVVAWTQVEGNQAFEILREVFLYPLILGGWVMVWWAWFRLRRPAWVPRVVAALTVLYAVTDACGGDYFFTVIPHSVGATFHLASVGIRILFLVPLVLIVVWGVREETREGWLVLPAVVLVVIATFQEELNVLHLRDAWFPFGLQLTLTQIAYLTLTAVLFALLMRRLLLSLRRQRELALDVKQAQEVQQVILPESVASLPGFSIETEYRPAREVGGDFFQIIPHATDGSVLIVAGDVTGKGLKAGMLVALIVGAIRSTAEVNNDPEFMLQALNRRLVGRGHAHATCLALRIDADGNATLANAGHVPPYLNGKPVAMEGALPLGLMLEVEFSVMQFALAEGDRLLLVSDGIAEAMDGEGRLFGFARVEEMLAGGSLSAAELAEAAQKFGQEDDISVIAVTRQRVSESASQLVSGLVLDL